jgi:hypothetical protein
MRFRLEITWRGETGKGLHCVLFATRLKLLVISFLLALMLGFSGVLWVQCLGLLPVLTLFGSVGPGC